MSALVTVVTITYNIVNAGRRDFLRQCFESVHNQTYKNIEHIVIDGASTDGTLEILQEYAEKGWIKYYSEPDSGIYDAMNKVFKHATGKYLTFLNSDDFYCNDKGVENSVHFLESNDADFSYAPQNFILLDGTFYVSQQPDIGLFYCKMPFGHQTLFVKTDVFKALHGFDLTYKSAADYDFIMRMILKGYKGVEVPEIFVNYRLGGLSDVKNDDGCRESYRIIESNLKKFDANVVGETLWKTHETSRKLKRKIRNAVHPNLKEKFVCESNLSFFLKPFKKFFHSFKKQKNIIRKPLYEYYLKERYEQKKALVVFHLNFLEKDRGCSNCVYEVTKILKKIGYSIDFFTVNLWGYNCSDRVIELNKKEQLFDNFYFSDGKDSCSESVYLSFNKKKIFSSVRFPLKKRYYLFNKCILSLHKKNKSRFSWVNAVDQQNFKNIVKRNGYDVLFIHYIQFSDLLNLVSDCPAKKVYFCHDLNLMQEYYANSDKKNVSEILGNAFKAEFEAISQFDKVMCISYDEMNFWKKFFPQKEFYFVPHPIEEQPVQKSAPEYDLLYIGADNKYNIHGLIWFVKNVYPLLKIKVKVALCGRMLGVVQKDYPEEYALLQDKSFALFDYVENLNELYSKVKVVINPLSEGTGMKIKTIEALSYQLPIVSLEEGVNGFPDKFKNGILVARNENEFAEYIEKLLLDKEFYSDVQNRQQEYFEKFLSYHSVEKTMKQIFDENNFE